MTYKLLIADDEQMERDALRYIIARGCAQIGAVLDAANGREAVEIAAREQPEIVLLDIKMPGINGVEAAGRILAQAPDTKLVFLTAYDYFDYAQQAIRLGVVDFLVKPATDERVVEVINGLVARLEESDRSNELRSEREHRLARARCALEEALVLGLVRGDLRHDQIEEQIHALDLEGRSAAAASITVDFASYPMQVETEAQRTVLRRRCVHELKAILQQRGITGLTAHGSHIIHALLLEPPEAELGSEALVEVLETFVETVRRKFSIRCVVGVEPEKRPPAGSAASFRSAVLARSRAERGERGARDRGGEMVVPADDFALESGGEAELEGGPRQEDRYGSIDELEHHLCEAVAAGDEEHALELAQATMTRLLEWARPFAELRRAGMELVIVTARRVDVRPAELRYNGVGVLERIERSAEPGELQCALREAVTSLCGAGRAQVRERAHQQIERARSLIEHEYARCLSLEELAGEARLSPYYFSRAFKLQTGSSFVDYLNLVRVGHAKRLLRESSLSVKEIATAVGFSDPNYFSRVFKHHTQITPTQYRSKTVLQ